jgi:hypothetical protein
MRSRRVRVLTTSCAVVLGVLLLPGCGGPVVGRPGPTASGPGTTVASREPLTTRSEVGPASQRAVREFLEFATGRAAEVSWAAETTLFFNGDQVARMNRHQARRRATWVGCPPASTDYEGRACPISVLEVIRYATRGRRSVSIHGDVPAVVGCNRVREPERFVGEPDGAIRPDQDRDCFGDFAVVVHVDDRGDVSAVNLVLSGP